MEDCSLTPLFCVPYDRFSALHHAALGGSLELIALLLEAQATVDIKDNNGESPMYRAMWGSQGLTTDLGPERLLLGHTNKRLFGFLL